MAIVTPRLFGVKSGGEFLHCLDLTLFLISIADKTYPYNLDVNIRELGILEFDRLRNVLETPIHKGVFEDEVCCLKLAV